MITDQRTVEEKLKDLATRFVEADQALVDAQKRHERAERDWKDATGGRNVIAKELSSHIGPNIPERHIIVNVAGEDTKLVVVDRNGVSVKELVQ